MSYFKKSELPLMNKTSLELILGQLSTLCEVWEKTGSSGKGSLPCGGHHDLQLIRRGFYSK